MTTLLTSSLSRIRQEVPNSYINIPASTTSIDQGASGKLAAGLEMRNDYGFNGYGGACPPEGHGMHRYKFTVWALPVEKLEVPDDASCALVSFMLRVCKHLT